MTRSIRAHGSGSAADGRVRDSPAAPVVSEGNDARIRDVTIKVDEYAKAKITEYWVVDPMTEQVIVYRDPSEGKYLLTEKFCRGQEVVSGQFSVAQIAVSAVFDARNFPVRRQGE